MSCMLAWAPDAGIRIPGVSFPRLGSGRKEEEEEGGTREKERERERERERRLRTSCRVRESGRGPSGDATAKIERRNKVE